MQFHPGLAQMPRAGVFRHGGDALYFGLFFKFFFERFFAFFFERFFAFFVAFFRPPSFSRQLCESL